MIECGIYAGFLIFFPMNSHMYVFNIWYEKLAIEIIVGLSCVPIHHLLYNICS